MKYLTIRVNAVGIKNLELELIFRIESGISLNFVITTSILGQKNLDLSNHHHQKYYAERSGMNVDGTHYF